MLILLAVFASGAFARTGYVTNAGSENVSAFDTQTSLTDGSAIPVGRLPDAIAITPNGSTAYVANAESNTVSMIDTRTNQVIGTPIEVGHDPDAMAITPDGSTAYVTNRGSNTVSAIDTQTNQAVGTPIEVGKGPDAIAIAPNGSTAYVANAESNSVSMINTSTNQVIGTPIEVGGYPRAISIVPDGSAAYIADETSDSVAVLDLQTNHIVGTPIEVGKGPDAIAITPDGSSAYVANAESHTVSPIDTQSNQAVGTPIPVGGHPEAIAIAPDGSVAYYTVEGSSLVSEIDTETNQVVVPATVVAGTSAFEIAIVPDQPPQASFTHLTARPEVPVAFDASASSDPEGTIAGYDWAFGDGTQDLSAGITARHAYHAPGIYKATLTLTDDEGCSTGFVFTGQTALCNGSPLASSSQIVKVDYPGVRLSCPRRAGQGVCKFKLQVVSRKHRGTVESLVASLKLRTGRSAIASLRPRAAYRQKLAAAKTVLAQETSTLYGSKRTRVVKLRIVR